MFSYFIFPCSPASHTANHKRCIELLASQVVASVVIRAAKLKLIGESKTQSTLQNMLPQLAWHFFAARQVGHKRGNTHNNAGVNLQYNNVARQVEGKCCSYYRTQFWQIYEYCHEMICSQWRQNFHVFSFRQHRKSSCITKHCFILLHGKYALCARALFTHELFSYQQTNEWACRGRTN